MRKHVRKIFSKPFAAKALIGLLLLVNVGLAIWLTHTSKAQPGTYPEAYAFAGKNPSFEQLTVFYDNLANQKGAVYAFNALKIAVLPPNIDLHLLGHSIGDILYKQKGPGGIVYCTEDFRDACSHEIVINTLIEKGPNAFPQIADLCKQAPGGIGSYPMCYHGLGHGVLAYNDYDLSKAVDMCEEAGPAHGTESVNCIGGSIMEMIAGVHDPVQWAAQEKNYFKDSDPLYPCDSTLIPGEAKPMCYMYLTPRLFEDAGANLGAPTPANFKEAFTYCLPLTNGQEREACLGGFGKEFTVLAQYRDIRAIGSMTNDQLSTVLDWCGLSAAKDGVTDCMIEALHSLYWGGNNAPDVSIRFCALADQRDPALGSACENEFMQMVSYFEQSPTYRTGICNAMPEAYKAQCQSELL